MPALRLSTGFTLLSEQVVQAAYYARGSFRVNALVNVMSAGRYGALETHEQNLLFIRTTNGKVHVQGSGAEQDATTLEQAGVRVYRSPLDYS